MSRCKHSPGMRIDIDIQPICSIQIHMHIEGGREEREGGKERDVLLGTILHNMLLFWWAAEGDRSHACLESVRGLYCDKERRCARWAGGGRKCAASRFQAG
jgi:hypothetical protein